MKLWESNTQGWEDDWWIHDDEGPDEPGRSWVGWWRTILLAGLFGLAYLALFYMALGVVLLGMNGQ